MRVLRETSSGRASVAQRRPTSTTQAPHLDSWNISHFFWIPTHPYPPTITPTPTPKADIICMPVDQYYLGIKAQPDGKRKCNHNCENKRSPEYQQIASLHSNKTVTKLLSQPLLMCGWKSEGPFCSNWRSCGFWDHWHMIRNVNKITDHILHMVRSLT